MTASSITQSIPMHRGLNIALWIAQGLLALAFGLIGFMKIATSAAELQRMLPPELSVALVRFIGVAELAGAIGLIVPAATRIKPLLTPIAALGLLTILVLAGSFHLYRGEPEALATILPLAAVAAFTAWGRLRRVPLAPR